MFKPPIRSILFVPIFAALTACGGDGSSSKNDAPPDNNPAADITQKTVLQNSDQFDAKKQAPSFNDDAYTIGLSSISIDAFFPDRDAKVKDFITSLINQGFTVDPAYRGDGQFLIKQSAQSNLVVRMEPIKNSAYQMIRYSFDSSISGTTEAYENMANLLQQILVNQDFGFTQNYQVSYDELRVPGNPQETELKNKVSAFIQDLQNTQGYTCTTDSNPVCTKTEGTKITTIRNRTAGLGYLEYTISNLSDELLKTAFAPNAGTSGYSQNENGTLLLNKTDLARVLLPENEDGWIDDAKLPPFEDDDYIYLISAASAGDGLINGFLDSIATPDKFVEIPDAGGLLGFNPGSGTDMVARQQYRRLDYVALLFMDGQPPQKDLAVNPNFYQYQTTRFYPSEAKAMFEAYLGHLQQEDYVPTTKVRGGMGKYDEMLGINHMVGAVDSTRKDCLGSGDDTVVGTCVDIQLQYSQPVTPTLLPDWLIK